MEARTPNTSRMIHILLPKYVNINSTTLDLNGRDNAIKKDGYLRLRSSMLIWVCKWRNAYVNEMINCQWKCMGVSGWEWMSKQGLGTEHEEEVMSDSAIASWLSDFQGLSCVSQKWWNIIIIEMPTFRDNLGGKLWFTVDHNNSNFGGRGHSLTIKSQQNQK